VDISTRWGKGV